MFQSACPTARSVVLTTSRLCLHRLAVHCMTADSQVITEKATGVTFPQVAKFWQGESYRCMGAGVRTKKVAFVGVKVYAVALYVEAEPAANELGIRHRGGFFTDDSDDDYNLALTDGAFSKLIQVQLVRKIEGEQFFGAIEEALTPRLGVTGEMATLNNFKQFFHGKSLEKGTNILLLWKTEGVLDVVAKSNPDSQDYSQVKPDLSIESPGLCRALFEVYTGSSSVVPEAKKSWADGARRLLESDEVRRNSRKSGGG
ncbi:hypothetical protein ABBQ32_011195 [Trebouxia sp. C0010 RCD-2024]